MSLVNPLIVYGDGAVGFAEFKIIQEIRGDIDVGQIANGTRYPNQPFQPGAGVERHPVPQPPQRGGVGVPIDEADHVGITFKDRLGRVQIALFLPCAKIVRMD